LPNLDVVDLKLIESDPVTGLDRTFAGKAVPTILKYEAVEAGAAKLSQLITPPAFGSDVADIGVTLQDWEGLVEHVGPDTFTARLLDRTQKMEGYTELAEIPKKQVRPGDIELLSVGSTFYLLVRRRIMTTGSTVHSVKLIFRRPVSWTALALEKIRADAKAQAEHFQRHGGFDFIQSGD